MPLPTEAGTPTDVTEPSEFDSAGLPARRAALDLLTAALARRTGLEEAASSNGFKALEPRDRAFARALVLATLRHLGPIDRALDSRLRKEPPENVHNILRLGLAQAFVLKTPPHAAVGTSVDLVASFKDAQTFKGLTNAILRGLLREPPDLFDAEALAAPWLMARWQSAFGPEAALAMARVFAEEPATDLTLRQTATEADLALELDATILMGGSLRTSRRGDVSTWPGFEEGQWWVQDASAAVPARLLDLGPEKTGLDLCAAPGGKTLQMAATGATIVAVDRSAARLKRVSENLARMGLEAEVVTAEASTWSDTRQFDAVLLDAPCSATGTYRRNPDVMWAARPGDIPALAQVQARLLDSATARVRPGGQLVYCVCSLEPEEGEAQVQGFLARTPAFSLDPVQPGEGGSPVQSRLENGTLRILPHHREGGTDGFFIARFRRTS